MIATRLRNLANSLDSQYSSLVERKQLHAAGHGSPTVSHQFADVANVEKLTALEEEVRTHSRALDQLYRLRDQLTP
jgi:hypothetical protein